jgi:galactokinase
VTAAAETVRTHFRDRFGAYPAVMFRAPGRVTLIGDHTDYQGGVALTMAVPMSTWAAVRPRSTAVVRADSTYEGARLEATVQELHDLAQGPRPVVGWRGLIAAVWDLVPDAGGADVWVESDLPVGVGLSSSAAVTLALLAAIQAAFSSEARFDRLPAAARRVENDYLGVPSGILDPLSIALAQPKAALFIDAGAATGKPVPFAYADAGYRVWVVDTMTPRTLAAAGYADRVREVAAAAAALGVANLSTVRPADVDGIADPLQRRRARHVVTENARVRAAVDAAAHGRWPDVMALFNQSHASLSRDYEVSTPRLDETAARLRQVGVGARVSGAGFGGSLVAMGPTSAEPGILEGLADLYREHGWPGPTVRPIPEPAPGLERVQMR